MVAGPRYPSLYQLNTRVWLERLSREAGRRITLEDIDDATIDSFAERGFDWIWLLSVWQTGAAGRAVSRSNPQWRDEFQTVLPDLIEDDISGSGFAITAYTVGEVLGGERALAQFRERLARRGIKLMLDFVPNHTAPDHPWVKTHPEYYVEGSEEMVAATPENYLRIDTGWGPKILAFGRDPNFPGWPDTLQLNYANPALQATRIDELIAIAGKCDGLRCDMAMLVLPEIFHRTWGITPQPFWPKAAAVVHDKYPAFTFVAEAYWDFEWTLHQQGFDYCYDKRLYDRLRDGHARSATIWLPASTTRTSLCAFSKTTTNHEPRPNFPGHSTRRPPSSPSFPPACASFIRANSRERGCGYRPISAAVRSSRRTRRLPPFIRSCYSS
jgi:glycosidase